MRKYGITKNVSDILFVHNGEIIFHDLKIINVVKIREHRKMCVYEIGYSAVGCQTVRNSIFNTNIIILFTILLDRNY